MKHLRLAIRSYSGLLLAGAILLQVTFLPAQPIPIAVVEFEGNGISQTEAIALTDRLRNELFRLGAFEVVERGMMESILTEQDFQLTGCTSNECLVEVGQLLGARQVVGGRISRVGAMFTVSARVVDVQTGKLLGVSDFDLRGGLEEMLTRGMREVAERLAGLEADEISAPALPVSPATPPNHRPPVSATRGPVVRPVPGMYRPIEFSIWGYRYDGELKHANEIGLILLSLNDKEVNRLVEKYRQRTQSADQRGGRGLLLGAGMVATAAVTGENQSLRILSISLGAGSIFMMIAAEWSRGIADSALTAAVRRYNKVVAGQ